MIMIFETFSKMEKLSIKIFFSFETHVSTTSKKKEIFFSVGKQDSSKIVHRPLIFLRASKFLKHET